MILFLQFYKLLSYGATQLSGSNVASKPRISYRYIGLCCCNMLPLMQRPPLHTFGPIRQIGTLLSMEHFHTLLVGLYVPSAYKIHFSYSLMYEYFYISECKNDEKARRG